MGGTFTGRGSGLEGARMKQQNVATHILALAITGQSLKDSRYSTEALKTVLEVVWARCFTTRWFRKAMRDMRADGFDIGSPRVQAIVQSANDEGLGQVFVISRDFLYRVWRKLGIPGTFCDLFRDATDNAVFSAIVSGGIPENLPADTEITLEVICEATLAEAKEVARKYLTSA